MTQQKTFAPIDDIKEEPFENELDKELLDNNPDKEDAALFRQFLLEKAKAEENNQNFKSAADQIL